MVDPPVIRCIWSLFSFFFFSDIGGWYSNDSEYLILFFFSFFLTLMVDPPVSDLSFSLTLVVDPPMIQSTWSLFLFFFWHWMLNSFLTSYICMYNSITEHAIADHKCFLIINYLASTKECTVKGGVSLTLLKWLTCWSFDRTSKMICVELSKCTVNIINKQDGMLCKIDFILKNFSKKKKISDSWGWLRISNKCLLS